MSKDTKRPIIIKRKKVMKGGHHGGSWKVAYADFVTAMMAFFLLMWLLNVTSVEQKKGIANYFSAVTVSSVPSSQGLSLEPTEIQTFEDLDEKETDQDNPEIKGPQEDDPKKIVSLQGKKNAAPTTTGKMDKRKIDNNHVQVGPNKDSSTNKVQKINDSGVLKEEPKPQNLSKSLDSGILDSPNNKLKQNYTSAEATNNSTDSQVNSKSEDKKAEEEKARIAEEMAFEMEQKKFDEIARKLKQSIQDIPELKELAKNLIVDMTDEGLRIQVVDELKKPMFSSGSAVMFDYTKTLLEHVGKAIANVPNKISISGHTDAVPYKNGENSYSNWELSSDRAHSSRRVIVSSGIAPERVVSVIGKGDKELLMKDEPTSPINRRISLTLLFDKKAPLKKSGDSKAEGKADAPSPANTSPIGGEMLHTSPSA